MADYQVLLRDPFGNQLAILDAFSSLEYTRTVNGIGALVITLPMQYDQYLFVAGDVKLDNRIEVYRRIGTGLFYLETETQWFVRKGSKLLTEDGQRLSTITCEDANSLLKRRIVAYNAGSSQADKTTFADDMMKAIVSENFGASATDVTRSIATYLVVQANLSLGPSLSKAFARRRVLPVLQELAASAFQAGTFLAFDVVSTQPSALEFRTYTQQRGIDHRWPSGSNPVIMGAEYGNLTDIERGYDHTKEITYAYAGGQGQGANRQVGTSTDATRANASPFNRVEDFLDGRSSSSQAGLNAEADNLVRSGNVLQTFKAKFLDTPATTYGLHFGFGDQITGVFEGETIDLRVNQVHMTVRNSKETIDIKLSNI